MVKSERESFNNEKKLSW